MQNSFTPEHIDLINKNLKRGDKADIASEYGVSRTYVTRVLDVNDHDAYSEDILSALLTRALENREAHHNAHMSQLLKVEQLSALTETDIY